MEEQMTLHEGQDVEVAFADETWSGWRKAKLVYSPSIFPPRYEVEFTDGTRGVFDEAHIRAIATMDIHEFGPEEIL